MVNLAAWARDESPRLTTNRRGVILWGCGKTCERFALARKSMIAGVVFALFSDACRSCTFGNSSAMANITGSRGNLNLRLSLKGRSEFLDLKNTPLLP